MLAVARRGVAGLVAFGTDLEAGVAGFFATALGLPGEAFPAAGFAAGAVFLARGFLGDGGESVCSAALADGFTDADAFGW